MSQKRAKKIPGKPQQEILDFEIVFFEGLLERDPQYIEALQILGDAYTKNRQYEKGLRIDQRLAKLRPDDGLVLYNLACSLALTEKIDEALESLEKSVDCGYDDAQWMTKDRDLEKLRSHPRFRKLME